MPPQHPPTEPHLSRQLLDILHGSWMTQALRTAAELSLADHIHAGARSSHDLAHLTSAHEPSLHRLLRALCAIGICLESADGAFELTDLGHLLRDDHPQSLRAWILWWGRRLRATRDPRRNHLQSDRARATQ